MDINEMTHVDTNYDSDQIQVLEGLEAVRKRPGMYIGSTGPRGLHHLVYEIVDNAIDEALAGYCDRIDVRILPGDIICVQDNGRGVPVGVQHQTGLPAVTVVYTILHAGGKFGGGSLLSAMLLATPNCPPNIVSVSSSKILSLVGNRFK